MGEHTEISWCDSTFSPWIGCMKVSAGCNNCYAETMMDKRYHRVKWGQRKTEETEPSVGSRIRTSASNWRNPVLWNKRAPEFIAKHGHHQRVFCASLSDVFDNQVPPEWRTDLWAMIEATPELDWLLLTKRPENIGDMIWPKWDLAMPSNVWVGVTCEDQRAFDERWPIMHDVPAIVRFVSYEPAIGPLRMPATYIPDWVICGGETGPGARMMDPAWARQLRADTNLLGIPFFLKQMTKRAPIPLDLRIREFPEPERAW